MDGCYFIPWVWGCAAGRVYLSLLVICCMAQVAACQHAPILSGSPDTGQSGTGHAYQVSEGNFHSVGYYFQISPESPDGQQVVYTRYFAVPLKNGRYEDCQVYICNRDGTNHRALSGVLRTSYHLGLYPIWLDDETVAYYDPGAQAIHMASTSGGDDRAYPAGPLSMYSSVTVKILFKTNAGGHHPQGVYTLDRQGNAQALVKMEDVAAFAPLGPQGQHAYDPAGWRLYHPYWSPDGNQVSFLVRVTSGEQYVFVVHADGSQLRCWSKAKPQPGHYQWWDNASFRGHDYIDANDRYLRRWDMEARVIETLAGRGNPGHGAISSDSQWIVTDDNNRSGQTLLFLYRRGETAPVATLVVQDFHGDHSHMHPAFSRDGRRVYYNYNVPGDNTARLYCLDLSSLMSK